MSDTRTGATRPRPKADRHTCASGLIKFSGFAAVDQSGNPTINSLADSVVALTTFEAVSSYPFAVKREARNLAVQIQLYTVMAGGSIVVALRKNGVVVPGFSITFGSGETGIKAIHAHESFDMGDTLDLQVTTAGITDAQGVRLSATIGLEEER